MYAFRGIEGRSAVHAAHTLAMRFLPDTVTKLLTHDIFACYGDFDISSPVSRAM